MPFQPASDILIGHMPFDNSYKHVLDFPDAQTQATWFSNNCTSSLSRGDYTYVRLNNSVRVPFNAEKLYGYNYCMFRNENYGSKWFYSFIVACNYINENCTELVLELDVMQTWMFNYTVLPCFVEREHVNDDSFGTHINPEPEFAMEYTYTNVGTALCKADYAVIQCASYPHYNVSQDAVYGSNPIFENLDPSFATAAGCKYQGTMSGCAYLIYKLNDDNSVKKFFTDLDAFNGAGCIDSIVNIFTLPSLAINPSNLVPFKTKVGDIVTPIAHVYQLAEGSLPPSAEFKMYFSTDMDGYTPKNNKTLIFPYNYIECGDYTGSVQDWRWEFFEKDSQGRPNALFSLKLPAFSEAIGYLTPKNYFNFKRADATATDYYFAHPFTFDVTNHVPWVSDTYLNWAAQNGITSQMAVVGAGLGLAGSVIGGAAAATSALTAAQEAARVKGWNDWLNNFSFARNALDRRDTLRNFDAYDAARSARPVFDKVNATQVMAGASRGYGASAAGFAGAAASAIATNMQAQFKPSTVRGNISGNSKLAANYSGMYIARKQLCREFAEIVDNYFNVWGYKVDTIKVPNITGRRNWNYVKTVGASFRGEVPANDMRTINSIYDGGVTFWHSPSVGDYSLNNDIV